MKKLCGLIALLVFYLFIFGMLVGCSHTEIKKVYTNQYMQTDYDYNCLDGTKTFTQIIICYQAQDNAEKAQNKITNKLLEENNVQKD